MTSYELNINTPFDVLVNAGVTLIRAGIDRATVMHNLTRESTFIAGGWTEEELLDEIEFWVGKPKKG